MAKVYEALYTMEELDKRRLQGIVIEQRMNRLDDDDDDTSKSSTESDIEVLDKKPASWITNIGEINKEDWRVPGAQIHGRGPGVVVEKAKFLEVLLSPIEEFDTVFILNGENDALTGKRGIVQSVEGRYVTIDIEEAALYGVKRRIDEVRKICADYTYVDKPGGKKGEYSLLVIDNDD